MTDKSDTWLIGVKFMRYFYSVYRVDANGKKTVGL